MKTKTISIRIDEDTEQLIEDIMRLAGDRYNLYNVTKSQVVCASIREFASTPIMEQVVRIKDVRKMDGRKRFRYGF